MNPHRPVQLKRGQIVVAFLAVTAAYAVGLWLLKVEADARRHESRAQIAALRHESRTRIAALQQIAVDSCRSRHLLADIDIDALVHGIEDAERGLTDPSNPPGVIALLRQGIRRSRKLLVKAHTADCLPGTLPLPAPAPSSRTTS